MCIDFPEHKDQNKDVPAEIILKEHNLQMRMFKHYHKQQLDQNFRYLKLMFLFVLISVIYFAMQCKGILANFLIGTSILGAGTLYIMLTNGLFLAPPRDREVLRRIKSGRYLEEKYSLIIKTKFFQTFDELQDNAYIGAMLSRFGSFTLVLTLTATASIALFMTIWSWLAIYVCAFATIFLIGAFFFYKFSIRKNFY